MPKGLYDRLQGKLDEREKKQGISPIELLDLPADLRSVMHLVVRQGRVTVADLAAQLELSVEDVEEIVRRLVAEGYLKQVLGTAPPCYKADWGRRRGRQIPAGLWTTLVDKIEKE